MSGILRWFKSTPRRTFILFPLVVVLFEIALRRGDIAVRPCGAVFLVWGYLQYRLTGAYRIRRGGGGPGIEVPPTKMVTSGPYRFMRNPMYLGHLIFMAGLAIAFSSWPAVAILAFHIVWFQRRVIDDESRLELRFGASYREYAAHVKRWIPGIV